MRWQSITVLVRADVRTRWLALVALGLLAGVVGALAAGSLTVARRTDTAVTRLADTAGVGDALITVYGDTSVAPGIADLDTVSASVLLPTWLGLLDGPDVQPIALLADEGAPRAFFHPTIVEGRAVSSDAVDEVVMFESFAREAGVAVGTEFTLHLLGFEQSFRFAEGLGEPEGPTVTLRVVGTIRTTGVVDQMPPLVAGPAFAEEYADDTSGVAFAAVQLHDGAAAAPQLEAELQALQATASPVPGLDSTAVDVAYPARVGNDSARSSQRIIAGGLLAFALVVLAAGLLSLGQAMSRLHERTRDRSVVEAALGLTTIERIAVRALPGALVVTVATLVTVGGAFAAGAIEPLGALRAYEPAPGFAPNLTLLGLGTLGMALLVAFTAALAAIPSARARRAAAPGHPSAVAKRLGSIPLRPPAMIGTVLAFEPARHRGGVPLRSVRAGLVLALVGVIAVLVVTANLDDLLREPARYGATADVIVSDLQDDWVDELLADDRVAGLSVMDTGTVTIEGRSIGVDSVEDHRGQAGWTLLQGTHPVTDDEIVLGPRAAAKLDREIGDVISVETEGSEARDLRVVGIGLGPDTSGGQLGGRGLLSPTTLLEVVDEPSREGLVRLGSDVDAAAFMADYSERWEVHERTVPAEITNLDDVGGLPRLLAAFLALVGVSALANGLLVAVRRRRSTIAVLRTLGFTPGQSATTILTMTGAVVVTATVIGVPLGLVLGAALWREVASSAALAPDVSVPTWPVLLVALVGAAVSLAVAAVPSWRAARLRPAEILREP